MKTIFFIIAAVLVFAINTNKIGAQIKITLYPSEDVTITSNIAGNNPFSETFSCGTRTTYNPKGNIIIETRSLIKFDLSSIPQDAVILNAKLTLYGVNHVSPITSYLQPIVDNWSDSTLTWNNQPEAVDVWSAIFITRDDPYANYEIDMFPFVDAWVKGAHNYGLLFRQGQAGALSGTHYFNFASSDDPDSTLFPKLEITYVTPIKMNFTLTAGTIPGTYDITTNITGGTAPYNLSWNTGATTANLSGVQAGVYTLSVTDAADSIVSFQVVAKEHFPVTWTDLNNTIVDGNKLISVASTDTSNTTYGAASLNKIEANTDGCIRYTVDSTGGTRIFGLSETNTNAEYSSIEYGFYLNYMMTMDLPAFGPPKKAKVGIVESGVTVQGISIPINTTDVYEIIRTGSTINYIVNNRVIRQTTTDPNKQLIADASFDGQYAQLAGVEMTSAPKIKLIASDCGATNVTLDQTLTAIPVTGATQYEFLIENSALGFSQSVIEPTNSFQLQEMDGIEFNTIYNISIRVYINSIIGNYGDICTIKTFNDIIIIENSFQITCGADADFFKSLVVGSGKSLSEIPVSSFPLNAIEHCGKFDIYFEDLIVTNPQIGFAEQTSGIGIIRRNTFCAVLAYIQGIFDFSNIPEASPIRLYVSQSLAPSINPAPIGTTYFAKAGPHYNNTGISHLINGFVYDYVTSPTGTDPININSYHATLSVNFDKVYNNYGSEIPIKWHDDYTLPIPNCYYDLYSILLHEIGHTLGWLSLISFENYPNLTKPVSSLGNNQFSGLDFTFYKGMPAYGTTNTTLEKLITSSSGEYQINSLFANNSSAINSSDIWSGQNAAPDNHPVYSGWYNVPWTPGTNFAPGSILSHMDDQNGLFKKRARISPGNILNYVMGPFGVNGILKRNFIDNEINTLISLGYIINPMYPGTSNLTKLPPYSIKMAEYNYPIDETSFDFCESMNADFLYSNGVGTAPLIINLADDITLINPEHNPISVAPGSITNIRGCGNIGFNSFGILSGNNHNLLSITSDGQSITYTPDPSFYGRAQFGFKLYDAVTQKTGSYVMYTIDVTKGTNYIPCLAGNNIILNGDFEKGTEVKILGQEEMIDFSVRETNILRDGQLISMHLADAQPYSYRSLRIYPIGSGDIIKNSLINCNGSIYKSTAGSFYTTFPETKYHHPDAKDGIGQRYKNLRFSQVSYYNLCDNMKPFHRYTFEFDYFVITDAYNIDYYQNIDNNFFQIKIGFTNSADDPGYVPSNLPILTYYITKDINIVKGSWQHISIPFVYCSTELVSILDLEKKKTFHFYIDNLQLKENLNPLPLSVSIATDPPAIYCNGQSITLTANVINPLCNTTFIWQPGNFTTQTITISPTTTTTYTVTITDDLGNTATDQITVNVPEVLSASISSQTNVSFYGGNDGTATVIASGGTSVYTYLWSDGQTTATAITLTSGIYTVTIIDANNCTTTASVTVTQPSNTMTTSITEFNVNCHDGNNGGATITVFNGTLPYSYSWSNGQLSQTITNLTAGIYSVTVIDANLNTITTSVTITEPTVLTANSTATNILCNGDNSTVTVSGSGGTIPYSGTGDFNVLAGTHNYVVSDANGCFANTSVTITEPTALTASSTATNILCNGDNSTVTVSGSGGTIPYSGTGDFNVLAGTHNYIVTDANGCTANTSVTITEPTVLTANSTATNILCNGDNSTVTVSGSGGTIPYSGTGDFNVLAGTHNYIVTDANGCTANTSVTITEPTVLTANSTATNILCNGGSSTVTVTGSGGTIPYSGTGDFNVLAGTHNYVVSDANGCTANTSVTIEQPTVLTNSISQTNVSCFHFHDGTATVTANGGTSPYTYLWNDPLPAQVTATCTGLSFGIWTVTTTDGNLCSTTASVTITQPAAINATAGSNSPVCEGQTLSLTASGGTSYSWSGPNGFASTMQNPLISNVTTTAIGTYTVTVTNSTGCLNTASVTVVINPLPSSAISLLHEFDNCEELGTQFTCTATTNTLSWNFGDPNSSNNTSTETNPQHIYSLPGYYHVTLTATNQCGTATAIPKDVYIVPAISGYNNGCCISTFPYTYQNYTIDASNTTNTIATWSTTSTESHIYIKGTLTIEAGYTLKVLSTSANKVFVHFGPEGKVIVKQKGKLIIDGAAFTSIDYSLPPGDPSCVAKMMWFGIEVWGNSGSPLLTDQGSIEIKNQAIIEDAFHGVLLGRFAFYYNYITNLYSDVSILTDGGGKIFADNSTFNRNSASVTFAKYNTNNYSKIQNCIMTCKTGANYSQLLDPYFSQSYNNTNFRIHNPQRCSESYNSGVPITGAHIWAYIIKKQRLSLLYNNTFENSANGLFLAGSFVKIDNCKFNDLDIGIRDDNWTDPVYKILLNNNIFNNIGTWGIFIKGGGNHNIYNCQFIEQSFSPFAKAIFASEVNNLNITDNYIENFNTGIYFFNQTTSSMGGFVGYQNIGNSFKGCKTGVGTSGNYGLLNIRCNQYENPSTVNYERVWNIFGALQNQGNLGSNTSDYKKPAGNMFNKNLTNTTNKEITSTNTFTYYHHGITDVNNIYYPIALNNAHTYPAGVNPPTNIALACTPDISPNDPTGMAQQLAVMQNSLTQLNNQLVTMIASIDNGQTSLLLNAINTNIPNGQLKTQLVNASPLSDDVLLAVINRTNSLPPGNFKEVIIPNSPVSDNVRPDLDAKISSLPNGIAKQIIDAQSYYSIGQSPTALQKAINATLSQRQTLLGNLITYYLENDSLQQAINMLEAEHTVWADRTLTGTYLESGDPVNARNKLNNLPLLTADDATFFSYYSLLIDIAEQQKSVTEMDSLQLAVLHDIAGLCPLTQAGASARIILEVFYGDILPPCSNSLNTRYANLFMQSSSIPVLKSCYLGNNIPNPFNGKTSIPYIIPLEISYAQIVVRDVFGKEISTYKIDAFKTQLDISLDNFESGVYSYSLCIDDQVVETKKMVLVK